MTAFFHFVIMIMIITIIGKTAVFEPHPSSEDFALFDPSVTSLDFAIITFTEEVRQLCYQPPT
jgi:hypothetical protein